MKKVLFAILAMLALVMSASAGPTDQCKISGTTDGSTATVSIDSYDASTKKVTVGFYNDSDKVVTIIAMVKAKASNNSPFTCATVAATVQPRSSYSKIATCSSDREPIDIEIQSAKCQ